MMTPLEMPIYRLLPTILSLIAVYPDDTVPLGGAPPNMMLLFPITVSLNAHPYTELLFPVTTFAVDVT